MGLYRDNGKYNGNCYNDYIGFRVQGENEEMETKMETTIGFRVQGWHGKENRKYHNELHRHCCKDHSFILSQPKASLIGLQGYGSDCRD